MTDFDDYSYNLIKKILSLNLKVIEPTIIQLQYMNCTNQN